jgi:PLP dependent protein
MDRLKNWFPLMNNPIEQISDNYRRVVDEVAQAATSAGRDPNSVKIVGVSKYVDAATTRYLFDAGCQVLGESRPQSLWDKAQALADIDCRWHMIGHLQRNKIRRTLPLVAMVHSIDSLRLAEAISSIASDLKIETNGLLEVNISGDASKGGFALEDVADAIEQTSCMPGLRLQGLMAMSGLDSSPQEAQQEFAKVRRLRDDLLAQNPPQNVSLDELSMGMSGDFREAIAEGATLVRVGSRLFEGI